MIPVEIPRTPIGLVAWVYLFIAWTLPPVAVYAPKGTVVIVIAAALGLLFDRDVRAAVLTKSQPVVMLAIFPFMGWAFAAIFWTPDPSRGLRVWIGVVSILLLARVLAAGASLVPERNKELLYGSLALAGLLFVVFVGVENLSDGFVIKFLKQSQGKDVNDYSAWINPGNAILAVCAGPIAIAASRRVGFIGGLVSLGLIASTIALGPMKSATMAVLISGVVFVAVVAGRRRAVQLIALSMAVAILAMPFIVRSPEISGDIKNLLNALHINLNHRLAIWTFVGERIGDHPIIGWGLDSSRLIPGGSATVLGNYAEILPLHPHNGVLQVWLELGAVGAVGFLVVVLSSFDAIVKTARERLHAALLAATFSAYLTLGQLSFGVWQNWWLATGCVALCLSLIPGPRGGAQRGDDQA